jgi:hypothetical protein
MEVVTVTAIAVIGIPVSLYLFVIVHRILGRICVSHASRFCARGGLAVQRARWQPQFDSSGVKTEFTLVQLDCVDSAKQRRLLLLSVWLFGVRNTITDEAYPDSYDSEWPQPVA